MNARTRAITISMHTNVPAQKGFKRQVVFRISAEEWPLLEAAARKHGSIQAAVIAGIRGLDSPQPDPDMAAPNKRETKPKLQKLPRQPTAKPTPTPLVETVAVDLDEEIRAREAAKLLGLKTDTVSGYIRSGRLPGRYDAAPTWRGWVTPRGAVSNYQRTRQG